MKSNKDYLFISVREFRIFLVAFGVLGGILATTAIEAAYDKVGFHSAAGHAITAAIVVVVLTTAGVIAYGDHQLRRTLKEES